MRVAVTGGTGFVGSHSVAALINAGHSVRLLVRDPARIAASFGPLGVDAAKLDHHTGDVTDPSAVERLLEGCDAVLNAASIYSLDPRRAKEIRSTNVAGTRNVLVAAHRLGLDPIIHVSSVVALMGERGKTLDHVSDVGESPFPYSRSKADSERTARRLQGEGAPVASTYPGQVLGPHDPYWGEGALLVEDALKGQFRFAPQGRVPFSDVRDVARLHVALMEPGKGARRFLAPSVALRPQQILDGINAVTGRDLKTRAIPYGAVRLPLRGFDALQRILPWRLSLNSESIWVLTRDHPVDDSATQAEFGIAPRPLEETLEDQIRWMLSTGRLKPKLAGRLGEEAA